MAQYDLLLTQNVAAAGTEFSEILVNIAKGGILSANASGAPTVLPAGTDGYMLVRDDAEATGLKWVVQAAGHTQNTDTGTTQTVFHIDSDGFDIEITAVSADKLTIFKADGTTPADFEVGAFIADSLTLPTGATVSEIETAITDSDTKIPTSGAVVDYVAGFLAANDAMVFKGTVGTGGTLTLAALDALTTYNAGDTYKVIEASADLWGNVVEIGDLIIAIVDRTGSGNLDSDWTVVQTNLDGAVTGPASNTADGNIALFNGTTGKIIKDSTVQLSDLATAAQLGDYVAKALFDANTILSADTDNTPAALTVGEVTIVGRASGGNIAALTPAQAMNILWVAAPAAFNSTGTAGQIAKDDNYYYVCTATDTWKRTPIATNWT